MRLRTSLASIGLSGWLVLSASCGGGGPSLAQQPFVLQLDPSSVAVLQDGTTVAINVTVVRSSNTNSLTLSLVGLPAGASAQIVSPGTGNAGKVTLSATSPGPPAAVAAAGTYPLKVEATDGMTLASADLAFQVQILATVLSSVNTSAGANGRFQNFMATSFQPAEWDSAFFVSHPSATTPLDNLHSQHIRLQPVSQGTPQQTATTWDFSTLNSVLEPVAGVADKSPELQIATAPAFMRNPDGTFTDPTYAQFAQYCANLVKYYNKAGFTDLAGVKHVHSVSTPITWWGIFNEPNINQVPAAEYPKLYNAVVPAMQAADLTIKFVAVELADFGNEPQNYLPPFVANVTAQVDAVATHYYSSCNQADLDPQVMNSVTSTFVPHVQFIYSQLKTNPALANKPVWVTENNVNADFDKGGGLSACNGTPFVADQRGSSAFFAAWRPYVFSQLGQAGVQSLYHWDFDADVQFGEVDYGTAKTYRSYWVDYELARYFPFCPVATATCAATTGESILNFAATETATVEILATRNDDGSVVVMVANHALRAPGDNNGPGDPRTVVVDTSTLGAFASATQLTIDANTDPTNGPSAVPVTPAARMTVSLGGYGVSFLSLKP